MSIVADVLAAVRQKGGGDKGVKAGTATQLEVLMKRAEDARKTVCQTLESRYISLDTVVHDTKHLHHRVESALDDLTHLHSSIEQEVAHGLEESVGEVGDVVRRWREVVGGLEAANTLLTIHTLLDDAHLKELNHEFLQTAKNLNEVEKCVEEASEKDIEGQLDLLSRLREELLIRRNQLMYTIGEVWNETLTWDEERGTKGSRSVTLVVQAANAVSKEESLHKLEEMCGALYLLGELQRRLKAFGKNLMTHIFKPLINGAEVKVRERSDGSYSLTIISQDIIVEKTPATAVLVKLVQVFQILHHALLCVPMEKDGEQMNLMHFLGQEVGQEFTEVLIKDCLAEAVPCSRAQLQKYEDVKNETSRLQTFLTELGFYSPDDQSIMEYAANVDLVFSNKACAHLLERARELMTRPVHDTVCVAPLEPDGPLIIQDETGKKLEQSSMRLEKLLAAKTFNLPKCQISESVCELVELIYETMEEACTSSAPYAGRLFYTVRNILTLYCHVVPTAHAHSLATIPQQAAVVHNNSMYLAHHALLLGQQYNYRLPDALRGSTITTADLAQELRKMATATFLKAMQGHRTAVIETLRESAGLDVIGCDAGVVNKAEQGMRQCLHKLQLLHRVWQHVLPHTVYTKAMGTLVGSVVEEVVTRVVALEDISADSALALIKLLNLLKDNIPPLFQVEGEPKTNPGDVIQHVRRWGKFCELIVILGASLRDILDRWSSGKGPLAHEFTPDEAKQLIRALFQNTSRRAQVLASIK